MDFALDETQVALRDSLRNYLTKEVAPVVDQYEAEKKPVPMPFVKAMRDFGLIGGLMPESVGGFGLSTLTYGMLIAEVARVWPSLRSVTSVSNIASFVLAEYATAAAREKYLPGILGGEKIACFALSEPDIGSDAAHVKTRAERTAKGWRINGRKLYITNGPICDMGVVFARTEDGKGGHHVSCFIFEKGMPGFSCTPISKMGMHSAPLGELLFDNVEVPEENLIGVEGAAFSYAKQHLNVGRSMAAFSALGVAEAALDAAVRFAKDRVQFGRPIGEFQLVQQMIADMMVMLETSRLLCYRSADAVDRKLPDNKALCSMAKRYVTDSALRVAEISLQVHGGAGYTAMFPVERYYRDVRHLCIAEGTNQIQSMLIAQTALGLSAMSR